MGVIRAKVRSPSIRAQAVPRPRLARWIAELVERFPVVWVLGTAGAGKTTAVVEALASREPFAWLTLDSTEAAPGRLLTHLEAALTEGLPHLRPAATDALAADIPHIEAAGLLAEAIGPGGITVVVDELERIAHSDAAKAVLAAFLRYAPPAVHAILISRRTVPLRLGSARELDGVRHVTEADLAFSVDEAAQALEALGHARADAEAAVQATGGWVAGVLFEAWRSPDHTHGSGGEADPLSGYLSSEIMRTLPEREREFLVTTSLLPEVTAKDAEALGHAAAGEILAGLGAYHLPVAFSADGGEMRCHPRFREYLQARLRTREAAEVRGLHGALGLLLISAGRHEEAVQELLDARDLDAAEQAGELAIPAVLRRRDFAVVDRWLQAFRQETIDRSEQLTYAQLIVAMEQEQWVAGGKCADRLLGLIRRRGAANLDPGLVGAIVLCYIQMSRLDDAFAVIDDAREGPERDAWRFVLGVALVDDPHHYRDRPDDRDAPIDGFLARLDTYQGRFERLLEPRARPWAAARSSRIEALRAVGRLDDALAMLTDSASDEWTPSRIRLYGELMADLNRPQDAYAAARQGRELLARSVR